MYYFKLILLKAYKEEKKLEQYAQAEVTFKFDENDIRRATQILTCEPQNPGEKIYWRNEYWDKLIKEDIVFLSENHFAVSAGEGEECENFKQWDCEEIDDEDEDDVMNPERKWEMLNPEDTQALILNPQNKEVKREVFKVLEGGKFKES